MIDYTLDGVNIRSTYGVYVSSSTGIIGMPKKKPGVSVSYADENGTYVDMSKALYEDRTIQLKCFIQGTGNANLLAKFNTFTAALNAPGLHYLCVLMDSTPKLLFTIYNSEEIDMSKEWSDGAVVGTFNLKLVDPMPIKRCYTFDPSTIQANTQVTIKGTGRVSVHWGDGSIEWDFQINTSGVSKTHAYAAGTTLAYLVITGDVDNITKVQFNLTATKI